MWLQAVSATRTTSSLPRLRWGRRVPPDAHPDTGSTALRPSPAGPAPDVAGRRRLSRRRSPVQGG
jgi:hypothetical protein